MYINEFQSPFKTVNGSDGIYKNERNAFNCDDWNVIIKKIELTET